MASWPLGLLVRGSSGDAMAQVLVSEIECEKNFQELKTSSPKSDVEADNAEGGCGFDSAASWVSDLTVDSCSNQEYQDAEKQILGCKHYQRRCKVLASCCKRLYTCRRCHDEAEDHTMDRTATKEILCMVCGIMQSPDRECTSCKQDFARHFCAKCNLWEDCAEKNIYHCDQCGICRHGKGLGEDFFHCTKCNACVSVESKTQHYCLSGSLECNCPVCHEYLYNSPEKVIFMKCGHTMHHHCFQEYTKHYFTCPLCRKALGDMADFYRAIDERLKNYHEESPKYRAFILCNDCEVRVETLHHPQYHRCEQCKGYNTVVLRIEPT